MDLPKPGSTYAEERRGIAAVQSYAANRAQIWRETDTGDVGIDGNLEFVIDAGFATGRLLAVQVKSGPSYFAHPTAKGWKLYVDPKHRRYWEAFPLPVIVVLHDSATRKSYWTDARRALRAADSDPSYIEVPASNVLEETDPVELFETAGVLKQAFIEDISDVLKALLTLTSTELGFPISYFDMFVHGLTNIARAIYYGMDLIVTAVDFNLEDEGNPLIGNCMGPTEHRFVFGFVQFLLAQNLAHIDYAECLVEWIERGKHPHFVAPLTSRGRALVALIHEEEKRLVTEGKLASGGGLHVAQEGFFGMKISSYFARLPRIRQFQTIMKGGAR